MFLLLVKRAPRSCPRKKQQYNDPSVPICFREPSTLLQCASLQPLPQGPTSLRMPPPMHQTFPIFQCACSRGKSLSTQSSLRQHLGISFWPIPRGAARRKETGWHYALHFAFMCLWAESFVRNCLLRVFSHPFLFRYF